jgi:anti-sigma-K factor RskA
MVQIDEHIRTAGPFREGVSRWERDNADLQKRMDACSERQAVVMSRLDRVEERNKIADANWAKLIARGLLLDKTGP